MRRRFLVLMLLLVVGLCRAAYADVPPEQQTWYLLMVDRFCDGDPGNNAPLEISSPDHSNWKLYWGGDLKGVTSKLDYLHALGITTVWMTPIIKNPDALYSYDMQKVSSYHGYWPLDDGGINPYFGTMQDFDALVRQAHRRQMKVVLDVVLNHTSPIGQGVDGAVYDHGKLQALYGNDPQHWFHHNGSIDFAHNPTQQDLITKNLGDLADLAQENPQVSDYLMRSYGMWVQKGVDGIRIDAGKHMDPQWIAKFVSHMKEINPKLMAVVEWFGGGSDVPDSVGFEHTTGAALIDFRLREILLDQFEHVDANWQDLMWYLGRDVDREHPERSLVFLDNHDTPRFLTSLMESGLSLEDAKHRTETAMQLLMVVRGIPCIYYDDEDLYHNETDGGRDPYNRPMMSGWDTHAAFFQTLHRLADLRAANPALGGSHLPKCITPNFYAFERKAGDDVVLVAINKGPKADRQTFNTAMPDGTYKQLAMDGPDLQVQHGSVTVTLQPWQIGIWSYQAP
ncbi:MAG: alpha-amylase family glycosyl hydrolase [Candidatus Xenobia bacterium]